MERSKQEIRWVLLAQAGDRDAFDQLLRLVQGPLYRYIAGLVGARPLAEDILQEVFILIYRKLRWLRERNSSARGPTASPRAKRSNI